MNMLWNIEEQIMSAASMNINVTKISKHDTELRFQQLSRKYANGTKLFPLWEHLDNDIAIQHPEAWKWIAEYIGNCQAILMFNPSDEKSSFEVEGGENLVKLLSEMFNVEFYVTNKNNEYLLCFNHHDVLIACGDATEWIKKYENIQG